MPSAFYNLCGDAPVFYTAVQEAAAATVIQAVVWKRLAVMAAAATVIASTVRRLLAKRQLWLGSGAAITIKSAAQMLLAKAKLRCIHAAEEQRRTVAALAIQRVA